MRLTVSVSLIVASVMAVPLQDRQNGPSVTISNGQIVGKSFLGVDTFNGIPFAKPPIGPLRLKPPQAYDSRFPGGTFNAAGTAKSCIQAMNSGASPNTSLVPASVTNLTTTFSDAVSNASEDCLTLNIQRPAGIAAEAKLPVLFWVFGGGFATGSSSMYDATGLLTTSVTGGHPVIFVAVNYRLSAFGFLAGKELQQEGSTNLGLRDQRLALQWVADNIGAFGGDPAKVTIWGDSAGAISVTDQTIINNGDHTYKGKPLFQAVIAESGTIVPAGPVDIQKAQDVYNGVVAAAGCSSTGDTLSCLRSVSSDTFAQASNSQPGIFSYRALDLAYLPRPDPASSFFSNSPETAFKSGSYAKVPVIAGDQEDEGTLFSLVQSNITTSYQLTRYIQSYFPASSANVAAELVATYPDDPSAGSPFRTGLLNNIYPQYKRLAAILGDIAFTLLRRAYLYYIADTVPTWSFLDTHLYGTPVLGTLHGNDVLSIFNGLAPTNVVDTYRYAIISFAYYQNPNKIRNLNWPQWKSSSRQLMNIDSLVNKIIPDDFRNASYNFLVSNIEVLRK